MSDLVNVVFRGDILPGHNLPNVKAQMAQLFKLDDTKLAAVFSGKPVVLKKDCDVATAEKVKAALTKIGADAEIKPANTAATPPPPPKPVSAIPAAAIPAKPIPPPSLSSTAAPPPKSPPPAMPVAPVATPTAAVTGGIKLAPVGPVLTEVERAALRKVPVSIKIDHLGLEKRASSFSTVDDKPVTKRVEIKAPDFEVMKVGSDLLNDDEKRNYDTLEIDLSDFSVAEVGADMLSENEKIPLPVMEIEELTADLAPVGADMAQIKAPPPPPPPKIDHIKLA